MKYGIIFTIIFCGVLAGCAGTDKPKATLTNSSEMRVITGSLNICRPRSIIKFLEAPDLYLNGTNVGEISNGEKLIQPLNLSDKFEISLQKSFLIGRKEKEILLEGEVKAVGDLFFLVSANSSISNLGRDLGLAVISKEGGDALANALGLSGDGGSFVNYMRNEYGWTVRVVDKQTFKTECE